MSLFFGEFLGTMIFMIFGSSAVAGALLPKSKAFGLSWVGLTLAWAIGVTFGIYVAEVGGGGQINPALTLALALTGLFPWEQVPEVIIAQLTGGFLGAVFSYLIYSNHWRDTDIQEVKLAVFAAGPAKNNPFANFITEVLATFVLAFAVLAWQ